MGIWHKIASIAAFMALAICVPVYSVSAQSSMVDTSAIPDMPYYDIPTGEFVFHTKMYDESPMDDRFLAYTIRLPKEWTRSDVGDLRGLALGKNVLLDVTRFFGPLQIDSPRSSFVMRAGAGTHEMPAKNWFLHYVHSNGYILQAFRVISDDHVEGIFVQLIGDDTFIVRSVLRFNDNRMIMASYLVPEQRWEQEHKMQSAVMQSLKLTNPSPVQLEERDVHAFFELMRFDYPQSWSIRTPNIFSTQIMEASLINSPDGRRLDGEINFKVISNEIDTTLAHEVGEIQKKLEERGFSIEDMIPYKLEYKHNDFINFSRVEVYRASHKERGFQPHEYWVAVLGEDRFFYIVTMLTPSQEDDFYSWSRNAQAYSIVLETLRP